MKKMKSYHGSCMNGTVVHYVKWNKPWTKISTVCFYSYVEVKKHAFN
jgi:hypothetical protein